MNAILLVDSEAVSAEALRSTLEHCGFHVEVADSVECAHRRLKTMTFNLVLLEFTLQSEGRREAASGLSLARSLKASHVNIPILMYSCMEGEAYAKSALNAGADEFISKATTSIQELLTRIHIHVR